MSRVHRFVPRFAAVAVAVAVAVAAAPAAPAMAAQAEPSGAFPTAPPPPPAPPPVDAPPPGSGGEWQTKYEAAREALFAGRFLEATGSFRSLAETAPDPTAEHLARELGALSERWGKGGFILRSKLEEASLAAADSALKPDRRATDELAVLYTGAVLYGIFSGVVLALHTEPDTNAGGILPALGFAAASAGLVAAVDLKLGLRYGVPQSTVSGAFIGLWEGIAWTVWHQASADYVNEWSDEAVATIFWASMTAGAVAGGAYGTLYGTTPGRSSFMGSAALWGAVVSGLTAGAIARDTDKSDDYAMLTAAIALNVGAVGGAILGADVSPSIARVRFLDLGAIAGGILFGGLYLAMGDRNENNGRTLMGVAAAGIATGVGAAYYFTRNMEPDHPRNRAEQQTASLTPLIGPTPTGQGLVLGLGGVF